jgi:hypothetical protein
MKMNKKFLGVFLVMLMMIATGITVAQTLKLQTNNSEPEKGATGWGWYNPLGSWVRSDYECFFTCSAAGWGRYSLISEINTINPQFFDIFPEAVNVTNMYGEAVVTGKNTYDFCMMDYATDVNYKFVYYRLWHGSLEQTSKDTMTGDFYASIFLPNQNPFEDEPYLQSGPYEYSYIRIPIVLP